MARFTRALAVRSPAPVFKIAVPRAPSGGRLARRVRHHRRSKAGAGTSDLTTAAIAGVAISVLNGIDALPTIDGIGKSGTIALIAYFLSKQGGQLGGIARTVCTCMVAETARALASGEKLKGSDLDLETV